jgi:phosphatidylglycerophosphate synthase
LARVTVTSSRFGHYFDHIIDIVHPPIWYILWGLGLEVYNPGLFNLSINAIFWLLMAGYLAGRIVEAVFTSGLGRFGIFCWRPLDSYFRLITARRNPCMIILTVSALCGRPDLGLIAVAFWTALTSIFLIVRLAMAAYVRFSQGPLRSWLLDADKELYKGSLAVKLFTRRIA